MDLSFSRIYSKLSRTTSNRLYIPEIDGLRFVAIFSVFVYHLSGYMFVKSEIGQSGIWQESWLARITNQGYRGVDLFFILSGFILAVPFFQSRKQGVIYPSLKEFYLRRVRRIEPPYVISLVILAFLRFFFTKSPDVFSHFLASVFYMNNLIYAGADPINAVCWSLEVEIQFYLLVPMICWLLLRVRPLRNRVFFLLGCAAVSSLVRLLWVVPGTRLSLTLIAFLPYFLLGLLLADLYSNSKKGPPVKTCWWDLVGLAAFSGSVYWISTPFVDSFGLPLLLALFTWSALSGTFLSSALSLPGLTTIGGMCYSIYLFHYQVISALARFTLRRFESQSFVASFAPLFLIVSVGVLGVCGAYFIFVEKPFMSHSKRSNA